jgi:hypothetical protein
MANQKEHSHDRGGGCCGHKVPRVPLVRNSEGDSGFSRRSFLVGLGTVAIGQWALQKASARGAPAPLVSAQGVPPGKPLVVKPVLTYDISKRRPQTSWRNWGGVMTQDDVEQEGKRITAELAKMAGGARFGLKILPVTPVANKDQAMAVRA